MKKYYLTIIAFMLLLTGAAQSIPKLNSFPTSTATIFLDFDGHVTVGTPWQGGSAIVSAACTLTQTQITDVFNRVAEDFRPFNVNITTDSTVYLAAPLNRRNRVIITPSSAWAPGVGGLAYLNSFSMNDDIPCFVFTDRLGPNNSKMIAECSSHESGHTLGLQHQSTYDASNCTYPVQEYNSGLGAGQVGWSPIMGNSYYRNMTNWNNGQINTGCTNYQDNLSIITSSQNGLGYRTDDYNEAMNGSTTQLSGNSFSINGIITTPTDVDAFKFTLANNSNIILNIVPFNIGSNYVGANLDTKVELYNSSGTVIRTYNPTDIMAVNIDTVLSGGTYYVKVDGTGNINVGDYGSLGAYTIGGTVSSLPIRSVVLSGNTDKSNHNLSWKIVADEAIKEVVIESSNNAVSFKPIANLNASTNKFTSTPFSNENVYYRLKVTSVINQTVYSNTISLKNSNDAINPFVVNTLVENDVKVNATQNYLYKLVDITGRVVLTGNGIQGNNTININSQAKGMYVLQLFANDKSYSKKIIKN
ncbi:MAG: zinc-dependent metalloprotease [Ferruginibacter sp.]|nr:zinc-dependent metalloprotease [Ferruginibacter sp.]